jgi:hypothetical protein
MRAPGSSPASPIARRPGQQAFAQHLRDRLARLATADMAALGPGARVDAEVVRASFESALRGFAFRYGDVAVGGWRNSPYVVAQNVGAYLDVPRLLDSEHKVETPADADAYLARVESYAAQLDGETERLKSARGQGVVAPDFLLDKCLKQIRLSRSGDPAGWELVTSLAKRSAKMAGGHAARAAKLAADQVAPALDRQIAELEAHRAVATGDAGVWKFADGDAYYAWALSAGTTTTRSPDEVHKQGLEELAGLQARMDAILKAEGYSQGSVGGADDRAWQGPALHLPRQRCRPRRDHGAAQPPHRRYPRAHAAGLHGAGQGQCRGEAAAAGRGAGRAGRLWRAGFDRRHGARKILDQPQDHQPAQPVQPARPRLSRGDSRACLAGRIYFQAAAGALAAPVQCLFRRLGALCRADRRRARGL